jgi:ABC-type branched-subunit amino acid transport system substrate-binding protein
VTTGGGGSSVSGATSNVSNASVGVSRGTITVGGIFDETGPVDATTERDTVRAYFNEVNASGGVNGYKLQLVDCDSGYDPQLARQCSNRLISQGILAVVGWTSVNGEEPETPYLASKGIPIFGGLGVPSEYTTSLAFPQSAAFLTYGTAMGDDAFGIGIKKPGIIVVNANFIKPVEKSLTDSLHKHGIHETSVNEVDATKADYTDIVIKLRSEGADSIIGALDPFSYARLFQAMDRQAYHPKFFLGLGLDKGSAQKQYASTVYNAYSLTPVLEVDGHQNIPAMHDYLAAVQKYFPNQVPALDVYTEQQWVAARFFVEALRQIGAGKPVTRTSLVNAANAIKNWNNDITVPLSYAPGNHDPNRCFQYTQNKKGVWTTYTGWKCF